jgi:hypothetical protein
MPTIGMMGSKNSNKLDAFLYSPNKEIGLELKRRANRVRDAAKRQVPVKTGRLKRSIRVYGHSRNAMGQTLRIGTSVPYAKYVHDGTKPHMIYPRRKQVLKFKSGNVIGASGGYIYTRQVHHRGTKPNRFLKDNVKFMYMSK